MLSTMLSPNRNTTEPLQNPSFNLSVRFMFYLIFFVIFYLILFPNNLHMEVSLNYCSQNGGNLYRDPYYNRNLNIGPRIIGNLDQYPHENVAGSSSFSPVALESFRASASSGFIRTGGIPWRV